MNIMQRSLASRNTRDCRRKPFPKRDGNEEREKYLIQIQKECLGELADLIGVEIME